MSRYAIALFVLALFYYIGIFRRSKYRSESTRARALDLLATAILLWLSGHFHASLGVDSLELAGLAVFFYAIAVVTIEQFIITYRED